MKEGRRRPAGGEDPSREADLLEKGAPAGVFGYAAGKSIIAKQLVKLFPAHKLYTEVFCGSAAMFFTKERSEQEFLNDRNEEVAGALKAIKTLSDPEFDRLAAKDWVARAKTFKKLRDSSPTDKVDQLYKFLYIVRCSFAKNRSTFSPAEEGSDVGERMMKRVERGRDRLKGTVITAGDYVKPLRDHDGPGAFHFFDPPYAGYNRGDGIGEKEFDEPAFRKNLEGLDGRFLVTYGTKGKLDVSGFEIKRMKQRRSVRHMHGANNPHGDASITHLLISNFKLAKKSIGGGIEIDDVVSIIDAGPGEDRIMVTGSRTSVSVPEQIVTRAWKNDDPLLSYPERPGPVQAVAQLRFAGPVCKLDLAFPVGETMVAWTFDAQRAPAVGSPEDVAKSFSPNGSRFFHTLDGAGAEIMKSEVEANTVVLIDRPLVEIGLQTPDLHEYVLSKGDLFEGVLRLERDESLGSKYPWIATYVDRYPSALYDFPVLKSGAPMPPPGVSALPESLERAVPVELRFWELRGEEATTAREALIVSKMLAPEGLAFVDGELCRVEAQYALVEAPERLGAGSDWTVSKAIELACEELVEAFSPAQIEKASGAAVFCDAGDVSDGMIEPLVKALAGRPGAYVVCAVDSPAARAGLSKLGDVFRFRPGPGAPVDALKRVFVTSFPVPGAVERVPDAARVSKIAFPVELEKLSLARNAFLIAKYASPRRALEEIGPPHEWSGGIAMAIGPENRKRLKEAWDALGAEEKRKVEEKFHANFRLGKAEWSTAYVNDLPDSAFLFIETGGEKDEQGKTKPRALRHFPVRDKDGKVDEAHARNAIGRIPQSDAQGLDASKKEALQDKALRLVEEARKAIFDTPPGRGEREEEGRGRKPGVYTPSDDAPDLGKARRDAALKSVLGLVQKAGASYSGARPLPEALRAHPALSTAPTETYPNPADVGGWQYVITDKRESWIAFVDVVGKALLWTDRQEDGGVIGEPYTFARPDLVKADFNTPDNGIGPGFLLPAQGNEAYRRRARYGKVGKIVSELIEESRDVRLAKAEENERIVYGIVLEPDTVDAQNDVYSAEEVRSAAHRYMEEFQNTGLMHRRKINDKAKVLESFLAPAAFELGGQSVKKGTWCMAMRVLDDGLWKECKDGGLTGFSIGGSAQRVPEKTSKAMRKTQHQGIPITIDRPKGYVQHGRDAQGQPWEREYKLDYGYIPRTKGGDGEGIDVFLGPNEEAPTAYWIAQKGGDGSFDEWKVMLGFDSPEAAKKAYVDHIPERYFGEMHAVPVSQMKGLLGKEPEHKMQPEGPP